jgi:hypothetical protein
MIRTLIGSFRFIAANVRFYFLIVARNGGKIERKSLILLLPHPFPDAVGDGLADVLEVAVAQVERQLLQ